MRPVALALALALSSAGCSHNKNSSHQLTNRQIAIGLVSVAAVVGFVVLLSLQCNELTEDCSHR